MPRAAQASGTASSTSRGNSNRTRITALVVVALIAIWLVAFILSNSETVRVSFVFAHLSLSLIWVMIICAALGALLMFAIPRIRHRG